MALTTKGAAKSRAKFTLDPATKHTLNAEIGESVCVGERPGDGEEMLVWSVGIVSTAIPVYAVGSAVASGKVYSADDVVAAFVDTGKFAALVKAVESETKRQSKATATTTPAAPAKS